jgi:hypothetical protein
MLEWLRAANPEDVVPLTGALALCREAARKYHVEQGEVNDD